MFALHLTLINQCIPLPTYNVYIMYLYYMVELAFRLLLIIATVDYMRLESNYPCLSWAHRDKAYFGKHCDRIAFL